MRHYVHLSSTSLRPLGYGLTRLSARDARSESSSRAVMTFNVQHQVTWVRLFVYSIDSVQLIVRTFYYQQTHCQRCFCQTVEQPIPEYMASSSTLVCDVITSISPIRIKKTLKPSYPDFLTIVLYFLTVKYNIVAY